MVGMVLVSATILQVAHWMNSPNHYRMLHKESPRNSRSFHQGHIYLRKSEFFFCLLTNAWIMLIQRIKIQPQGDCHDTMSTLMLHLLFPLQWGCVWERERESMTVAVMAATLVSSMSLKPSPFIERSAIKNLPSLSRPPFSLEVQAGSGKKIKTASPYGLWHSFKLKISFYTQIKGDFTWSCWAKLVQV